MFNRVYKEIFLGLLALLLGGCPAAEKFYVVNLSGQVKDNLGAPVANAIVTYQPENICCSNELKDSAGICNITTDAQGKWTQQFFTCYGDRCSCTLVGSKSGFQNTTKTFEFDGTKRAQPTTTMSVEVILTP